MNTILSQFRMNWKSGISVALVSVPLSLSLAIASGAGPMAGIITAVWAGLIGGFFGGSNFNIIGPAGALAGILIGYALMFGPAILPLLAITSGIIILIVWMLGWDRYLIFVPSSVIHGFTLGVALTIGFGQLNAALGLSGLKAHESIILNIIESLKHVASINWAALIPFIVALALMFIILKYKPLWPNSIIVAILGILFGYLCIKGWLPFSIETVGTKYPGLSRNLFLIPNIGSLMGNGAFQTMTYLAKMRTIFEFSTVIAFVVILETLISAKIADGMTKTKFDQRKEVLGAGLSNILAGIFGGIPASGVFARTALNIKSGATSRYSQIINSIAVAILAIVLLGAINYLPLSITAAILVYAAMRMVAAEHFKKLLTFDKVAFGISIAVAVICIVYDATTGILVGTLVSLLVFARKISSAELGSEADPENFNPEEIKEQAIIYRFAGELTYINAKSHIEQIEQIPNDRPIILNFRHVYYIDVDGYEALDEILDTLEHRNQAIFIAGVRPEMNKFFAEHTWYKDLVSKKRIFPTTTEALVEAPHARV